MISDNRKQLVWFITGASGGLGLALVRRILDRGDLVIATARTPSKLDGLFGSADANRLCIMALDVTSPPAVIQEVMHTAVQRFGRVDVLVNNAGTLDEIGPGEEIGNDIFAKVFNTNFYGVVNCTNAILPHLRARNQGTVIIIGTRTVYRTDFPGLSAYGASKAAVHAYGEALAAEAKANSLGIRVSVVIPGTFQTSFNAPPIIPQKFTEYTWFHDNMPGLIHKLCTNPLAGDPEKGMDVIVDLVRGEGRAVGIEGWPMWLPLGDDAVVDIKRRAQQLDQAMETFGSLGKGVAVERTSL